MRVRGETRTNILPCGKKKKVTKNTRLIGRKQSFVGGGGGKNNIKTVAKVDENSRASKVV